MTSPNFDVVVAPVATPQDLHQANDCISAAFGTQTRDAIWTLLNPGWETEAGRIRNSENLVKRWQYSTTNKSGDPNTLFLKAIVPDPNRPGERRVAGLAIWLQLSHVDGWGDSFTGDTSGIVSGLDNEADRRLASQAFASLWRSRISHLKLISAPESGRNPPAIFVLDLCAVDPAFQRRGIAAKLVQAGLDEAERRGGLECTTEGSAMGRGVYRKLGFKDEGVGDIVFEMDEEFKDVRMPPNVFLRTWA